MALWLFMSKISAGNNFRFHLLSKIRLFYFFCGIIEDSKRVLEAIPQLKQ